MESLILKHSTSEELYKKACTLIPGGVNSPVRSFKSVGLTPLFISHAKGQYIYDADKNKYLDFVNSWGALICGHLHESVVEAIQKTLKEGISYGASHENEIVLAELITAHFPSIEKIRFVNSGTEAVMTALRLARAYTKRNKIIKFSGCYHGHSDSVLSKSGSGLLTFGIPQCDGVTKNNASDTITLPYNDISAFEIALNMFPKDIAAVILEPVVGNCGVLLPDPLFLNKISELCTKFNIVLIFDEVITGFRISINGAQGKYNIKPDLTTLGKIIGGGMPLAAVGGRADIMELLAPLGNVYQAGTLSGNPLSVASGIATIKLLTNSTYEHLENLLSLFSQGIEKIHKSENVDNIQLNKISSMFTLFFTLNKDINNEDAAKTSDTKIFSRFYKEMLNRGVYFAPSQFEANFLSTAMNEESISFVLNVYSEVMRTIKAG